MEFGRVSPEQLAQVHFALPPDRQETVNLLRKKKNKTAAEVFVGCAKWGRKDWVGKVYPPGSKEADFLSLYAQHFKCIELNATFYKIPTKAQAKSWREKVDDENFKFCPKFSQSITHFRRLNDTKELTDRFLEGVSGFGKNLGPTFLMLHPGMAPKSVEAIQNFVLDLPKDFETFVEFRHEEWFTNETVFKSAFDFLEADNRGAVITDASGRRDCVHMRLTTAEAFIRFVGNGLHPTDYTRVDDWVLRIKSWLDQGIKKIYFFMHQHEEIHSPELCRYVVQEINKVCGLSIPLPQFIEAEQKSPSDKGLKKKQKSK